MELKQTNQRIKIIEYLKKVKTHPTAEEVYKYVKKELPSISLGTVYRNLNLLVGKKIIKKIEINNEAHFEGNLCNHQHCICKKCNKIIDITNKNFSEDFTKKLNIKDFYPECINISFIGLCKNCKGDIKNE